MMSPNVRPVARGFALWSTLDGTIVRLVHDSLEPIAGFAPGKSIAQLLEPGSMFKFLDFLVEIKSQGAAFDWEMNIAVQGPNGSRKIETLHIAGVLSDTEIYITGAENSANLWQFYHQMTDITNEQATQLRQLTGENKALQQSGPHRILQGAERDDALYAEMSRLNNELVNLQRELAKKNRALALLNAQKDQFLGMAAHDLRNPLRAICSYSKFLLQNSTSRLSDEEQEFLTLIGSQADLMLDLVYNLLDVATIESGKLQLQLTPVDLGMLIDHGVTVYRPLALKKQITLEAVSGPTLPPLMLDGHKIEQVLNNLISNAIKYSPANTRVRISLTVQGSNVQVAVQDEGQGIPADEVSRLFQPFSTTSVKSTAGESSTGLGLLIAKKVVEGHQGKIWVESQVGRGSTFTFALPKVLANRPAATRPDPATPNVVDHPLRILLAEDSLINQRITLKILERLGYHADVAQDGVAVLEALRRHAYDLILMDIHMPTLDGLEATQQIRAEWPPAQQPTIIALSATYTDETRHRVQDVGMDGWLEKPTPSQSDSLRQVLASCPPQGARAGLPHRT